MYVKSFPFAPDNGAVLVYSNIHVVPGAISASDISNKLDLASLRQRNWQTESLFLVAKSICTKNSNLLFQVIKLLLLIRQLHQLLLTLIFRRRWTFQLCNASTAGYVLSNTNPIINHLAAIVVCFSCLD